MADSATSMHSTRISGTDATDNNRRGLPSLWAQVVRGGEAETLSAEMPRSPFSPSTDQPSFSDCPSSLPAPEPETAVVAAAAAAKTDLDYSDSSNGVDNSNVSRVKKAAWNKPSNGVVAEVPSPVMGAVSWPALSESTRPTPKSSSAESSSKTVVEVSVSPSQVPVIPQPPQKHSNKSNSHSNSNTNHHTHLGRSRSMKRGNGPNFNRPQAPPPVQTIPRPPAPPPYPLFEMPYANMVPAVLEPPIREPTPYRVPRPMAGVVHDHPSHRNPSRRGNFGGGRPRGGDTSVYANGFGGRRDHHDREWHAPRSSGHHMAPPPPPPPLPRAFIRPPHPVPAPFMASQPMRPFVNPMGPYDMTPPFLYGPPLHTESYRGAPLPPHAPPPPPPAPMFMTLPDRIVYQIEYYFGDTNLRKDNFLRSNMDDEGWVPITLIAGFHRVRYLTDDIQLILNSLRDSSVIELQGDKVRRRNEWRRWVQTSDTSSIDSGVQSPSGVAQTLPEENSFQKLTVDEAATTTQIVEDAGVSSVNLSQLANGEANTEASPSHI